MHTNWSFFESCHGKCYCDPEGGTLKNAAKKAELLASTQQFKTSEDLYRWAVGESGLATPARTLEEKDGRGIFRRFFYWIPSKGTGAVDRSRLPKFKADGTSQLHEFVDIGVPGTVSTRRAACHMCEHCWNGDRHMCENLDYTGPPTELRITREQEPATSLSRVTRSMLDRDGLDRAANAGVGSNVCVETHNAEQTVPWVIGKVITAVHDAVDNSRPFDENTEAIRFEPVRAGDRALRVRLWEPIEHGSSTFTLTDVEVLVPARRVRVVDVQLEARRQNGRNSQGADRRVITPDSLLEIRAEMPTSDDSWEVERVLQYRSHYRKEQWLIKWKNYGEDRNTWEPWENLTTDSVQREAARIKQDFLCSCEPHCRVIVGECMYVRDAQ